MIIELNETRVHIRLWHKDFWLLALSNLLLTLSVYVLIPVLPVWLMETENLSPQQAGIAMGAFAVGLFLPGAFCSWLVQHYRRNVVCLWAMAAVAACVVVLWYVDSQRTTFVEWWTVTLLRMAMGAAFGLAQMVLSSTLVIDTCESFQRTSANHAVAWFSRFALSLGPLAALLMIQPLGFGVLMLCAACLAIASLLTLSLVDFPFRTPEEGVRVVSLDRFFLPRGSVLFVNLLSVSIVAGLLLSLPVGSHFYALLMGGFLLALLAQRFVFRETEPKSEVISGFLLLLSSLLVLMFRPESPTASVLAGLGLGLTGSRFLIFFIKLSRHCQRGTSQSTFFLCWESGIVLGLALGYACFFRQLHSLLLVALTLIAVSLLMYLLFTHQWFMHHKNR